MGSTGTGAQRHLRVRPSPHGPGLKRRLLAAGGGLTAVVLAVPMVWGPDALPVEVPFLGGTAWLVNEERGEVAQVNGQTGTVEGRLGGLSDAEEISVTQNDDTVLVQADGEIHRIDPASLEWGEATLEAEGELVLGDGSDGRTVAYLVSPDGTVSSLDPLTLDVEAEVELAGTPGHGVAAGGRLVVPVRTPSGTAVEVVDSDRSLGEVTVGDPGDLIRVSRVGDDVAVLNTTADTVRTFDPSGSAPRAGDEAPVDLPDGELLVPTELPEGRLWIVAPRDGLLAAVNLENASVADVAVASPRHDLVGPVVLDEVVFVADRDAGRVVRVDAEQVQELPPPQELGSYGLSDASRAELTEQDGRVFVNDPASGVAVVFTGEGEGVAVDMDSASDLEELPPVDLASEDRPSSDDPDDDGDGSDDETPPGDPPEQSVPEEPPATEPPPLDEVVEELPELPDPTPPPPPTDSPSTPATAPPTTTPPTTTPPTTAPPTTAPPTTRPPEPPGSIDLTATEGDGEVHLSWTAAAGPDGLPISYEITSEPAVAGQAQWSTPDRSRTLTGLDNGTVYTFRVTPVNDDGAGPTASVSAQPAGLPTLTGLDARPDGPRSFSVSFTYDGNGRAPEPCEVTVDGSPVPTDCTDGRGTATVDVDLYSTSYTIAASVTTEVGTATGDADVTSAPKSLVTDGSESRWGGSCYWPELGTARPIVEAPARACLDGNGPDYYIDTAPDGSTRRAVCRVEDVSIQDDQENPSGTWVRLENGGWMNTLYFTNWGSAGAGLPTCNG